MNRRIIVVTTDGFEREDGNVYYSRYFLAEHSTKTFSETVFDEVEVSAKDIGDFCTQVRNLGYTIEEIDSTIIAFPSVEFPYEDEAVTYAVEGVEGTIRDFNNDIIETRRKMLEGLLDGSNDIMGDLLKKHGMTGN